MNASRCLPDLAARVAMVVLAGASLVATGARAQSDETLRRIQETGTINLGHRESSFPFSYYDGKHQVQGYSHELALRIVESIRKELHMPAITIKLVPVTSQNRMALVQNGTVDIECGSTSHTAERERQVSFSVSTFVIGIRMLTARDSGLHDFGDLAGRKVVVTRGTTSDRLVRMFNERQANRFTVVTAQDHAESFGLLDAGKVDAFVLDDALLYGAIAKSETPERWTVVGTPMAHEVYACMMRREDVALKRSVDRALTSLMTSGEILKIYTKWFQRPIPPNGLNLNWAPSEALLELYRAPNDRPQ